MKKLKMLPLLLLAALLLSACGQKAADTPLPDCGELSEKILSSQSFTEDMSPLSESKLCKALDLTGEEYSQASMTMDVSRTTAEAIIVITAVDAKNAAVIAEKLESYRIDTLRQYQDYRPEEAPKLENAQVMTSGLQCVLVIGSDQAAAKQTCNQAWGK